MSKAMLILAYLVDKKTAGNLCLLCLPGVFHHFAIKKNIKFKLIKHFYCSVFVFFFFCCLK